MKPDILTVFSDFHNTGRLDWRLNTTLLALIPKKRDPSQINDYITISLVSAIYKILSKLLANRLKDCWSSVISTNQSAFISERQILDGVLVSNELVDSRHKLGIPGLLFKADFDKAYDTVNWGFLKWVLSQMGFCQRWTRWIFRCISSVSYFVLIDGELKGFFRRERGLRQGDPLSLSCLL